MPERLLLTEEYTRSEPERYVYQLLYDYINKPVKQAFPEMESYDLALRLLGLQGSSTAAISQTIQGVIRRLKAMDSADDEVAESESHSGCLCPAFRWTPRALEADAGSRIVAFR